MTSLQVLGLFFLSGFASLDRLAGLNIMLSRPFVVAGIVGLLFHNIIICLFIGVLFEFIGMLEVPVGTTIVSDDTFGGYAASLLVATHVTHYDAISLLLCVSFTVVMMLPVTASDKYCRSLNRKLIVASIKSGRADFESKLISYGLIVSFLRGAVLYNAATVIVGCLLYFVIKISLPTYLPDTAFLLLIAFLYGYFFRFLSLNNGLKACLLASGMLVGWFVL